MCDDSDIKGYDISTLELSNTPLHLKKDTSSREYSNLYNITPLNAPVRGQPRVPPRGD